MRLFFLIASLTTAGCVMGLLACTPQPLPPEPPHIITIADASWEAGSTCEAAYDVLDALQCPEALDKATFMAKCNVLLIDFNYDAVAACRSTDCVRAAHVRCVYAGEAGP